VHGHERDVLEIGAILTRGPGAGKRELTGDVFCRQLASVCARAAPLQQVAGQIADVSANPGRIDACGGLTGNGWDAGDRRHCGHRQDVGLRGLLGLQSKAEQSH
jgi:hypothetical protein